MKKSKVSVVSLGIVIFIALFLCQCADYATSVPTAPTLTASAITDTSVTLSWDIASADNFYAYIVYISKKPAIDTTGDSIVDTIRYNLHSTYTIYGLAPQTRYFCAVLVRNVNNEIAFSNEVEFTTKPNTKEVVLYDPEPDSINDTVVHITWTAWPFADFRQYVLYYDTLQNVDTTNTPAWIKNTLLQTDTSMVIPIPKRGKKYWFKVHVQDTRRKFIASSNSVTIVNTSPYPAPVLSFDAASSTDSSIVISWSAFSGAGFDSYRIVRDILPNVTDKLALPLATITVQSTTDYADTTVLSGKHYYYNLFVSWKNSSGTVVVGKSNEIDIITK
jgi:hypothetical protein